MSQSVEPSKSTQRIDQHLQRYSRQMLCEDIGEEGQRKLLASRVVLVGCGALGTALANTLVRAGVGSLRICDRDFIELNNLQRQILFDEEDIAGQLPKAEAAARKLRRINSDVNVEPVVVDVNSTNVVALAEGAQVLLDGTDNFETRFLINDLSVQSGVPWVYGAVVGTTGLCMTVVPGKTPCLRCVFDETPPPDVNPTCDTAGVLGTVVNVVAAMQATEVMKLLLGRMDEINPHMVSVDVWSGRFHSLKVQSARDQGNCSCCKRRDFAYLRGERGSSVTTLCGRNAVQVNLRTNAVLDFQALADRLRSVARGEIRLNPYLLRATIDEYEFTLFADGRAIVQGTNDPEKARSLYAKYVGS
ncbi:MAG: ThiF family adenylyltransferase [Planctomycetota bacterium]